MAYQLRTRQPTGRVPWPLILIEGGEKSGKSWACAQFSTSKRIGQMYWVDLGEGAADEYGAIPGASYLVVEHDGTWGSICGAVQAITVEAQKAADAGQPPVVLVIDSMTAEWDMLKDWASNRARDRINARRRKGGQKPLAEDEEPKISMDLWNDVSSRHRKLMTTLMTFPGIVLITARGKEVAMLNDKGEPVQGARDYRVEAQKTVGFDASCWIRLDRTEPGAVVGVRSAHVGLRPGYDDPIKLDRNWSIENIVFDTLRCDPGTAHVRELVELKPGSSPLDSPQAMVISAAIADATTPAQLKVWWDKIRPALDAGEISQQEADQLAEAVRARKAEVESTPTSQPQTNGNEQPMVDSQRNEMFALFAKLGYTTRDDQIAYLSTVTGRPIGSRKDVTVTEARKAIADLRSKPQNNAVVAA
jgi:hypothetical protein